jgi:hypothetical protein
MNSQDTFDRMLSDHLRRTTPQIPHPSYKLDAVRGRIAAEKQNAATQQSTSASRLGLTAWLNRLFSGNSSRFSMAMGLVALQFVAIAGLAVHSLKTTSPYSETRTSSGMTAPAQTNFIRTSFKSTTTEVEIRKLLNAVQADIVAGPSQIGEYYLLTSQDQIAAHLATLKGSAFVESADVVNRLP